MPAWPSLLSTRRRRLGAGAVVAVAAAAVAVAVADPFATPSPSASGVVDNAYPTSLTTVKKRPLSSQMEVSATLGYAGSYTVDLPSGTPPATLREDESQVSQAEAKVAEDRRSLATTAAEDASTNAATLRSAEATVQGDTTALADARAVLASDETLSCPAASSSTVSTASSNTSSPGSTSPSSTGSGGSPAGSPESSSPGTGAGTSGAGTTGASTTAASVSSSPPAVAAGSATATGTTSASLSGSIDPNGSPTSYEFVYGATGAFGHRTAAERAGSGTTPVSVTAEITGLAPDTTYEFALVATNAAGTVTSAAGTFQTATSSCADQAKVVADDTLALASAKDALAADRIAASSGLGQQRDALTTDEQDLAAAQATLAGDAARQVNPGTTFTSVPSSGAVIRRGEAVYSLDRHPVPLIYGGITPYRSLSVGVTPGPDVTQLNDNLAALGYDGSLAGSDVFGAATEAAVEAWQAHLGLPATGVVALGDVVVAPGPIEVGTVAALVGQPAAPGGPVLTATSTVPEVTVALDASDQSEVRVGDAVSIVLPDNATTPGVISSVGSVATSSSSSGSGSGTPTVNVEVTPTRQGDLGHLDQASVNVWITTASVPDAYVVPVDALVALANGGYALEVVGAGGRHRLVAVSLGLFDDADGLVQVSGPGVAAGERVVVPAL